MSFSVSNINTCSCM